MELIGIITETKNEKHVSNSLRNIMEDHNIIFLNENNIDNVRNVKFNIIVLNKYIGKDEILKKIIRKSDLILLNEDIESNYNIVKDIKLKIITYGFNLKSTINTSSISNDEVLICLQRGIIDAKGNKIEPQEIRLKLDNNIDIYDSMFIECIKKLYESRKMR